mmetsp:Transcript_79072/g.142657  ORF Transcript_79072/g.142657 Transcript_79072/m.142657 type:complete len:728 (+) Transcript_79072:41-2224(+)
MGPPASEQARHPLGNGVDVPSPTSGGTAHVLQRERALATFQTVDMTHKLDGGPAKTKRRRWIMGASRGMELGAQKYHMSREQLLERHVKDFLEIHSSFGQRMGDGKFKPTREEVAWMSEAAMNSGPFWDHYVPFLTALQSQASDEQFAEWGVRAAKLQIIGSYAQTELGHGSNVRGLETLATFDQKADEWVLETPTLTAIKWWPGGLGMLATHAIVYAQLWLHGKCYGVHAFMLQLRDHEHRPLPGIELGELGPKMGDNGHDSGRLRLTGVRVPRSNLLARYQWVTPDGRYEKPEAVASGPSVPLHYSSMLLTRASWVQLAGGQIAKAAMIAVRYSAVRRQGSAGAAVEGAAERQLLDYPVQRRRLLTQVASAYAVKFAARRLLGDVKALEDPQVPVAEKARRMPALGAESGTLKAMATLMAADGIEDLRRCCGGNGYLLSSGIAALSLDDLWHVTAEGDFVVLLLAAARFAVKRLSAEAISSAQAKPSLMNSVEDWMDAENILEEFRRISALRFADAAVAVAGAKARGCSEEDALNEAAEQLVAAAAWRGYQIFMEAFWAEATGTASGDEGAAVMTPEVRVALLKLCALFGCHVAAQGGAPASLLGGMSSATAPQGFAGQARQRLCQDLRVDAVALVDAFDYEDRILNSTLGVQDGRVYEALYEASKLSDQDWSEPFQGYSAFLRPSLDVAYLQKGSLQAAASATALESPEGSLKSPSIAVSQSRL